MDIIIVSTSGVDVIPRNYISPSVDTIKKSIWSHSTTITCMYMCMTYMYVEHHNLTYDYINKKTLLRNDIAAYTCMYTAE